MRAIIEKLHTDHVRLAGLVHLPQPPVVPLH